MLSFLVLAQLTSNGRRTDTMQCMHSTQQK